MSLWEKKLILKYLECIIILFVVFYKDRLKNTEH